MQKGEIWRVDLTGPPSGSGREQAGSRPAIIVSENPGVSSPTIIVIPLTSKIQAKRFSPSIEIMPNSTNGLKEPSVALVFQMTALDQNRFTKRWGVLDQGTLSDIENAIRKFLGL